jgi:hypothetical protein
MASASVDLPTPPFSFATTMALRLLFVSVMASSFVPPDHRTKEEVMETKTPDGF